MSILCLPLVVHSVDLPPEEDYSIAALIFSSQDQSSFAEAKMKIVLITGSAHKHGTTAALAEKFEQGAADAGHEVFRFDAAFHTVHPCIACDKCRETGQCTFHEDDMKSLNPHLLEADAIAFVSPIYYFAINAQIKAVIDRFYANDDALHGGKKAVLITAMADTEISSASGANASFKEMLNYLKWENAGILNAKNATVAADLTEEDLKCAYDLGKNLK